MCALPYAGRHIGPRYEEPGLYSADVFLALVFLLRLLSRSFVGAITTFLVGTVTKRALPFGSFLQQKRRLAIRTRFSNRLVPINSIAIGIHGATIKNLAAFRLLNDQFTFATRPRTLNARRFLLDVFALRIV